MKTSTTRRNNKIPVFHPVATKLAAVKEVNTLITAGFTRNKAIETIRKQLKVHRTTVLNWLSQYGGTEITKVTPQQVNHVMATRKSFSINSLTLNTENGYVKLTPNDIKNIAGLDKLVRWDQ